MNQVVTYASGSAMLFDKGTFEQAQRAANLFANSQIVPKHFQGKVADCFIGICIAQRMQEDPLMVLQNMFLVSGTPGWKTQYMIARANASGVFKGRITWKTEGAGDNMKVTASAVLADTGETVSASADMKMAKTEGWTKNPKYQSMPEHMLRFRSAAFLIRLYAPEVMLGYQTAEELETAPIMKDVTPETPSPISIIEAQMKQEAEAVVDIETGEIIEQNVEAAASTLEAGATRSPNVDTAPATNPSEQWPPKVLVYSKPDNNTETDWVRFKNEVIGYVHASQSDKEMTALFNAHTAPLNNLQRLAPKLYAEIKKAADEQSQSFQQDREDAMPQPRTARK